MKILILQGSPNTNGSTAILAREFAVGAQEAGHDVDIVNVASLDVAPCTGCVACGYGGPCAQYDDFDELREQILASDMLVFATPLYYYGMTAQLKAVVDRFCSARAPRQPTFFAAYSRDLTTRNSRRSRSSSTAVATSSAQPVPRWRSAKMSCAT